MFTKLRREVSQWDSVSSKRFPFVVRRVAPVGVALSLSHSLTPSLLFFSPLCINARSHPSSLGASVCKKKEKRSRRREIRRTFASSQGARRFFFPRHPHFYLFLFLFGRGSRRWAQPERFMPAQQRQTGAICVSPRACPHLLHAAAARCLCGKATAMCWKRQEEVCFDSRLSRW